MSFIERYQGWTPYQPELRVDSHCLVVAVPSAIDGLTGTQFRLLDTADEWCVLSSVVVGTLELDPGLGEQVRLETRFGVFAGGPRRLPITFVATEGKALTVDATWLVSADRPGPLVLGWKGCLERIRFALDPAEERFYFGSW